MFHVVIVNFLFVCNLFNMFDKISMYRILLNLIKMVKLYHNFVYHTK